WGRRGEGGRGGRMGGHLHSLRLYPGVEMPRLRVGTQRGPVDSSTHNSSSMQVVVLQEGLSGALSDSEEEVTGSATEATPSFLLQYGFPSKSTAQCSPVPHEVCSQSETPSVEDWGSSPAGTSFSAVEF
ncbi:hypothetical protein PMAYCL1PPCAC_29132, partial [Pristionchus mayeri]